MTHDAKLQGLVIQSSFNQSVMLQGIFKLPRPDSRMDQRDQGHQLNMDRHSLRKMAPGLHLREDHRCKHRRRMLALRDLRLLDPEVNERHGGDPCQEVQESQMVIKQGRTGHR